MRTTLAVGSALLLGAAGCGSNGSSSKALVSIGVGLRGSPTLRATVYARGVGHAAAFAFDARGRLWIASSGATTHRADAIYLVGATGAKPIKVIPKVRGPLGLVWVRGSLYVSSLDGVTKFAGLSGGRFTRRTMVLRGPVAGAENNNLVLAPNGRLVMGVSATCDHCATTPRYSGAVVSFRTDGSDVKIVAHRVRAAYGLVFSGDVLYATMNQRDDLGDKTPGDWLAVVKRGQDWGFPQCYGQGGADCAGVPTPLATLGAHAAAGGVAIVGKTAVVAEWNLGTVVGVGLETGRTRTLVAGIGHPLAVIAAPGRSLLVGDWGSGIIYRLSGSVASS